jgi:biopolymer transport protein ExbD
MAGVSSGGDDVLALNIMPLLDIFSILILFLLMSFSTDPVTHDVNPALELPDSKTMRSLDEIPAIVVTKTEILVNDKKITTILNGDIQERDRSQGAIYPLFTALEKLAEANKRYLRGKKTKNIPVTMEMDKGHNFKLLKRIMLSAQQAEFVTFKLMVSKTAK